MAAAKQGSKKAGEAAQTAEPAPINQERVLGLIHRMFPDSREKAKTLQDGVTWLLAENDRMRRQVAELEKNQAGPNIQGAGSDALMAEIKAMRADFKQLKEQFSVMRQYGVGAGK